MASVGSCGRSLHVRGSGLKAATARGACSEAGTWPKEEGELEQVARSSCHADGRSEVLVYV